MQRSKRPIRPLNVSNKEEANLVFGYLMAKNDCEDTAGIGGDGGCGGGGGGGGGGARCGDSCFQSSGCTDPCNNGTGIRCGDCNSSSSIQHPCVLSCWSNTSTWPFNCSELVPYGQ